MDDDAARVRTLLRQLADLVAAHIDELTHLQVAENGKSITETSMGTRFLVDQAFYVAGLAENLTGRTMVTGLPNLTSFTIRAKSSTPFF